MKYEIYAYQQRTNSKKIVNGELSRNLWQELIKILGFGPQQLSAVLSLSPSIHPKQFRN